MDNIYSTLTARYDLTHSLLTGLIVLSLLATLYSSVHHPQIIVTLQRDCGPAVLISAGLLMSLFHATCLWVYVHHMAIRQDRVAQQQGISNHERRVFGLSRRNLYSRYVADLCFFNAILIGSLYLVIAF